MVYSVHKKNNLRKRVILMAFLEYTTIDGISHKQRLPFYKKILGLDIKEVIEIHELWKQIYEHNNQELENKLESIHAEFAKLTSILADSFKESAYTKSGNLKSGVTNILREQKNQVINSVPVPPSINVTIFSKKVNQDITVDISVGSEHQWFDLPRFYAEYYKKETVILNTKPVPLKEQTEDLLKCKEYILANGYSIDSLTSLNDFNDLATRIKGESLISQFDGESSIHIDFCDYCEEWHHHKGHRCTCGNRRCTWESEGNFLEDNIHVYPVGY